MMNSVGDTMEKSKSIDHEVGDIVQYFNDDKMVGLLVSIHRATIHSHNASYGVKWFDEKHHRWAEPLYYIKYHLVKVSI
jgi:hypothetical protein